MAEGGNTIFSKGNWIVHSRYGLGQVRGKDIKTLDEKEKTFFKVKTGNGIYWIPQSSTDVEYIRPVASKNQFKIALTTIRKKPKTLAKDYKKRNKEISKILENATLMDKAELLRDLNGRKYVKKLNVREKQVFEKVMKQFLNEWTVVIDEDLEELRVRLEKALETSIKKLGIN